MGYENGVAMIAQIVVRKALTTHRAIRRGERVLRKHGWTSVECVNYIPAYVAESWVSRFPGKPYTLGIWDDKLVPWIIG